MAWFLARYRQRPAPQTNVRYCAMDDFTPSIRADGGDWRETEVLGDQAIVKVRASAATLTRIGTEPGITRIPLERLTDRLADLTSAQRDALRQRLLDAGYTADELKAALGSSWVTLTLGDVLRFLASRRRKPRYDPISQTFSLDGPVQRCLSVDHVDRELS